MLLVWIVQRTQRVSANVKYRGLLDFKLYWVKDRSQPSLDKESIKSGDCSLTVPVSDMYSAGICNWATQPNSCALFFALWSANVLRFAQQLARHELSAWAVLTTQETRHRRSVGILVGFPEWGA